VHRSNLDTMLSENGEGSSQATYHWPHHQNEGPTKAKSKKRPQPPSIDKTRAKRPMTAYKVSQAQVTAQGNVRDEVRLVDMEMTTPRTEKDPALLRAEELFNAKYEALAKLFDTRPPTAAKSRHRPEVLQLLPGCSSAIKEFAQATGSDTRSVRQLQDENKKLQQRCTTSEARRKELEEQLSSVSLDQHDSDGIKEQWQQDCEDWKNQRETMAAENIKLQQRVSHLENDRNKFKRRREGLEAQLSSLKQDNSDAIREHNAHRELEKKRDAIEMTELQRQVHHLVQENNNLRQQLGKRDITVEDLQAQIDCLELVQFQIDKDEATELKQKTKECTDLQGRIQDLDQQIVKLSQRREDDKKATGDLKTKLRGTLEKQGGLEQQITTLTAAKNGLDGKISRLEESLRVKVEKVQELTTDYNDLVGRYNPKLDELEALREDVRDAATKEKRLASDLAKAKSGIKEFSEEAKLVEGKSNQMSAELKRLDSQLEKAKSLAKQDKARLQHDLQNVDRQRESASRLVTEHEETINSQATSIGQLKIRITNLNTKLQNATNSVRRLEGVVSRRNSERQTSRWSFTVLEHRCHNAESECENKGKRIKELQ
ncbi:MAG: hypothetical protein Q9169_008380, partial [Polycauliona sp. 2 TL-2023]